MHCLQYTVFFLNVSCTYYHMRVQTLMCLCVCVYLFAYMEMGGFGVWHIGSGQMCVLRNYNCKINNK